MRFLLALAALALLAGCADPAPLQDDAPRVSEKPTEPRTTRSSVFFEAPFDLTLGGTQSWDVEVPANATDVVASFAYEDSFFHLGLHLDLEGCGSRDYAGPGGALGSGPGTWEYPVCGAAEAGTHRFTVTVDNGLADATVHLVATVPK